MERYHISGLDGKATIDWIFYSSPIKMSKNEKKGVGGELRRVGFQLVGS